MLRNLYKMEDVVVVVWPSPQRSLRSKRGKNKWTKFRLEVIWVHVRHSACGLDLEDITIGGTRLEALSENRTRFWELCKVLESGLGIIVSTSFGSLVNLWPTSPLINGFSNTIVVCMKRLTFNHQIVYISKEELLRIFSLLKQNKEI